MSESSYLEDLIHSKLITVVWNLKVEMYMKVSLMDVAYISNEEKY